MAAGRGNGASCVAVSNIVAFRGNDDFYLTESETLPEDRDFSSLVLIL